MIASSCTEVNFLVLPTPSTSGMHRMVLGYDYDKINFKIRLCILHCPNMLGHRLGQSVGHRPTGLPIGRALSAAQTTALFVTENCYVSSQLFSSLWIWGQCQTFTVLRFSFPGCADTALTISELEGRALPRKSSFSSQNR